MAEDTPTPRTESTKKRPGRIASCDPCRTSKLACDHVQPVCSRCIKRGISGQCRYRESPFKRLRKGTHSRTTTQIASPSSTSASQTTSQTKNDGRPDSSISQPVRASSPSQFSARLYPNAGFLGASSLSAVLSELDSHAAIFRTAPNPEPPERRANSVAAMTRGAILMHNTYKVEEGANILNLFFDTIKFENFLALFQEWYGKGIELNLGNPYLKVFMETMTDQLEKIRESPDRRTSLSNLSRKIFENGAKPFNIHGSMTLKEFLNLYTGENLRWETVGFILTFVGLAAIENAASSISKSEEERQRMRMQMLEAGDACLAFCESFDNLNDAQIVLIFINSLLHSMVDGDQSFKPWRRMNDATSALFAFGLHEEIQEGPNVPFFLVQQRKRTFARIYSSDINSATVLGRPPRISKRYCYLHMPLDIDERQFFQPPEELAEQLKFLDGNGWNTRGQISRTSLVRWSLIGASIREDILELLLGKNLSNVEEKIRKIEIDIERTWANFPDHLKPSRYDIFDSDRSPWELDTLLNLRMIHLHNQFLLHRAITRHSRESSSAIFPIASEMLTLINDLIVRRQRLTKLGQTGLAWKVMAYSLPAAGVLALELLQQSRRKWSSHPETVPRTQTIQDLSVLLAHCDVLCPPSDGNYQAFRQAKRALQSILDIILAPTEIQQLETPHSVGSSNGFPLNDWVLYDQWGFDGDFWSSLADHPLLADNDINALS